MKWVFTKAKERKKTSETVAGGALDAIDRGCKLAIIPKAEIQVLADFCVSTESSVDLIFALTCVA